MCGLRDGPAPWLNLRVGGSAVETISAIFFCSDGLYGDNIVLMTKSRNAK